MGSSRTAYEKGFLGIIADPFGAGLCLVLAGLLFAKFFHRRNYKTIIDFFEARYGRSLARAMTLLEEEEVACIPGNAFGLGGEGYVRMCYATAKDKILNLILAHEFGHSLACRSVGGEANRIVLWPLGGIAYVSPPQRPGATLWSIAAGPLVNVALVPVLFVVKVGPDAYADKTRFPSGPSCKVGDFVIVRPNSGTRLKIHGREFRIINDDSVEAVVEDPRGIGRV